MALALTDRPGLRCHSGSHRDANGPDTWLAHASRFPAAGSQWGKSHTRQVSTNLLFLLLAVTEVGCFESHSRAPEGLLIPISDNSPQSLIIYSCPQVNNKTKQSKIIERDEKVGQESQNLWPSPTLAFNLFLTIAIKIITVYTAGLQKFSISRLICFTPALLSFRQRNEGESRGSFH